MYNKEWIDDYKYLEWLRENGACNMFGASKYLIDEYGYSKPEAQKILSSWMENYTLLKDEGII